MSIRDALTAATLFTDSRLFDWLMSPESVERRKARRAERRKRRQARRAERRERRARRRK